MNMHLTTSQIDFAAASRFVELIAGPEAFVWFRLIHDKKDRSKAAIQLYGTLSEHWARIEAAQRDGYGAFMVVNEGGNKDAEITKVRAVFIDADNKPRPDSWHVQPDFIVQRDASHWHAYWITRDFPVVDLPLLQKRLASSYGTDRAVCNASRVMRIPGLLHQKETLTPVMLVDHTSGSEMSLLGRAIAELAAGLSELSAPAKGSTLDKAHRSITLACLLNKLRHIDPFCEEDRNRWLSVGGALHFANERGLVTLPDLVKPDPCFDGPAVFTDWSAGSLWPGGEPSNYEGPDDCEKDWNSFRADKIGGATLGTIDYLARLGGYIGAPDRTQNELYAHIVQVAESSITPGDSDGYPAPLSASELATGDFPRAQYLIDRIILKEHVNVLYGDGGVGKTTLALNMAVFIATGSPFHNHNTMRARALLVLAEDDYGETKHRLETICAHYGLTLADLPIDIWCLPGHDVTLATIGDDGSIAERPFLAELGKRLRANAGMFVVLDSLADMACLNESQRLPANAFLKRVLGRMCQESGATILLLGHPSKASMQDGTHYSGSTAFNAGVRSRLVLEQPVRGSERRVLKVAKANYGAESDLELFLSGSVFLSAGDAGLADRDKAEREAVLATALEMIDKGISIVRGNGGGQKPADLARAIQEKHKIKIEPRRVLEILNTAERGGLLHYNAADRYKRGSKAGFVRGSAS